MTAAAQKAMRGQALLALAMVLAGWTGARLAWIDWTSDTGMDAPSRNFATMAKARKTVPDERPGQQDRLATAPVFAPTRQPHHSSAPALLWAASAPAAMVIALPAAPLRSGYAPRRAGAEQRQWAYLASIGYAPSSPSPAMPMALQGAPGRGAGYAPAPAPRSTRASKDRWSLDLWGFYRRGSAPAITAGQSQYGGQQAGGVLSYRLAPASAHDPRAYMRATIDGDGPVLAGGMSAVPLPGLPLAGFAEQRLHLSASAKGARHQTVVGAITRLPPIALPVRAEAEIYGQAGYAYGRDSTPFFDGQVTVERPVTARNSGPALHIGAGAWAGGQDDAARLDIGPRASLRLKVADGHARIAVDWRQRVAGDAVPQNGLTLTIAGSF